MRCGRGSNALSATSRSRAVATQRSTPRGRRAGSANGSPNSPDSRGCVLELDYLPLQNVRLMMQYTGYSKFNGGSSGYDGVTARSARDNNTLFVNLWVAY